MARDTRERILDTALTQFVARGVEAVTVTDLEQGAGLKAGSGSFYRHFRSKADLLSEVVTREVDRATARREAMHQEGGLVDEYTQALDALDAMRPLLALLWRDGTRLPHVDRIRAVLAEGGARLDASRLQERMDAGAVPARDAEGVASVVQMALVGHHLAERFFGGSPGVDRARFVTALADLVGR
ncbi:MAG: TetR/AcrR family transcriptional regulator [Actinomycetota bacterium]|nr:TetR/AcrR family transcriptional regulator [Actinomycetota bacterium]